MQVTPEIEEYFIAFSLVHGTNPATRASPFVLQQVSHQMREWDHKPYFIAQLKRAYVEASSQAAVNQAWFFSQLADAYLKWLSSTNTGRRE